MGEKIMALFCVQTLSSFPSRLVSAPVNVVLKSAQVTCRQLCNIHGSAGRLSGEGQGSWREGHIFLNNHATRVEEVSPEVQIGRYPRREKKKLYIIIGHGSARGGFCWHHHIC